LELRLLTGVPFRRMAAVSATRATAWRSLIFGHHWPHSRIPDDRTGRFRVDPLIIILNAKFAWEYVMIEGACVQMGLRCVGSVRRILVLIAMAGIGIGMTGFPAALTPSLDSSAKAQTSKSSRNVPDFVDVVERVKPAVVGVRTQLAEGTVGRGSRGSRERQESPLDQFNAPSGRPDAAPTPRRQTSIGSGFFISSDGYIVTTNHVIERATSIDITTDDGKSHSAKLVGADPKSDLALLKVDADQEFSFVRLSDRAPRIGEWVVAVGNPFGLGGTVTAGIVSARARDIKMGTYNDFLQIDAPMNQGNSGGPTFDLDGDVIGVNSAIFSPGGGGSIGIGFAIPAETVKAVVGQLKEKGKVVRGWMGVSIQAATEEGPQGVKPAPGARVVETQPNSPAATAGLAVGDVITSLNGEPIKDDRELIKKVSELAPGTSVNLAVRRRGEEMTIAVTLGELPG
jgi:serine protease Do